MNVTALPASCLDDLPVATFKSVPQDFQVDEILGFEPDGEGPHLWLNVRKRGKSTRELIEQLAKSFSISAKDIGHSGLKDKNAVTSQWLSLPMGGGGVAGIAGYFSADDADLTMLVAEVLGELADAEVIAVTRSGKKLRIGAHRQNRFKVVLRDIADSQDIVEQRLLWVRDNGFPNYFGTQRFGHDGRNVASARSMFTGNRKTTRFKRGLYLSAARSYLFNLVLAERVRHNTWQNILVGEACILDGTNSTFHCELVDDEIRARAAKFDIHPSGPLHGRGRNAASDDAAIIEHECLQGEGLMREGLEKAGLKQERRSLRAIAYNLQWRWPDLRTLELDFKLQKGVYATALLRELVIVTESPSATD